MIYFLAASIQKGPYLTKKCKSRKLFYRFILIRGLLPSIISSDFDLNSSISNSNFFDKIWVPTRIRTGGVKNFLKTLPYSYINLLFHTQYGSLL